MWELDPDTLQFFDGRRAAPQIRIVSTLRPRMF